MEFCCLLIDRVRLASPRSAHPFLKLLTLLTTKMHHLSYHSRALINSIAELVEKFGADFEREKNFEWEPRRNSTDFGCFIRLIVTLNQMVSFNLNRR